MVRELCVEPQYELKARNIMVKIFENPDVLTRNEQGELVINCVAESKHWLKLFVLKHGGAGSRFKATWYW